MQRIMLGTETSMKAGDNGLVDPNIGGLRLFRESWGMSNAHNLHLCSI